VLKIEDVKFALLFY